MFADEAGNFDFSLNPGASKYFCLVTVTMDNCSLGDALLQLRRDMGWRGLNLNREPHCTDDSPQIRNEVFQLIMKGALRIDATVLEKRKTQPHRQNDPGLYKLAWFLHLKAVAPRIATSQDRLFVVAASLGTRRTRAQFRQAVDDVVTQVSPCHRYRVASWAAMSDPCLWVADYCCWAVQRSWERGDMTYFNLLQSKISSNYDIFAPGSTYYY